MKKAYRATSEPNDLTIDQNGVMSGVRFTDSLEQAFRVESALHLYNQRSVYEYEGEKYDIARVHAETTDALAASDRVRVARLQVLKAILLNHDVSGPDLKDQVRRLIETQLQLSQATDIVKKTSADMLVQLNHVFDNSQFVGKLDKPRNRVVVASVPDTHELLNLDKKLSEQPNTVLNALMSSGIYSTKMTGKDLYKALSQTDLAPPARKVIFNNHVEANRAFLKAQADFATCNPRRMLVRPILNNTGQEGAAYALTYCQFLSKKSDSVAEKQAAASEYLRAIGIKGATIKSAQNCNTITVFSEHDAKVSKVLSSDYDHTPKVQMDDAPAPTPAKKLMP